MRIRLIYLPNRPIVGQYVFLSTLVSCNLECEGFLGQSFNIFIIDQIHFHIAYLLEHSAIDNNARGTCLRDITVAI